MKPLTPCPRIAARQHECITARSGLRALAPVGRDFLEQEAFELSGIFQEIFQLSIGNAELQRLDAMMLQRDQQMIRLLSQFHLNIRTEMKEAEQVQLLLESCFEMLFFQDWIDVRIGSLRIYSKCSIWSRSATISV